MHRFDMDVRYLKSLWILPYYVMVTYHDLVRVAYAKEEEKYLASEIEFPNCIIHKIAELQRIMVLQCQFTSINPL